MNTSPLALCLLSAAAIALTAPPVSAAGAAAESGAATAPQDTAGIAWRRATSDADIDAAFALARAQSKPVFLYWGASWCPPCNQLRATLFNRQDFIERSRAFVPVYVDGDGPGAQKLGARFKVRGYPTTVLFSPAGTELTRLPGEVDPQQYAEVLTLGMNARRPVREVLAAARSGGAGLTTSDWRLLAFYSWETDDPSVPDADLPATLAQLAAACPAEPAELSSRLLLKAVAARGAADAGAKAKPALTSRSAPSLPSDTAAARARVLALLADAAATRAQMDVLTNGATDIARALSTPHSPERATLVAALDTAMQRLQADAGLSRADRLTALLARVQLATVDRPPAGASPKKPSAVPAAPTLPTALLAEVRADVARLDRETTDGFERQAVVTTAAGVLRQAGLLDEAEALLRANLTRSHAPYYLMAELADLAQDRGDKPGALRWMEQAFDRAEGPATRLQWGAWYVQSLVETVPRDGARIERVVAGLIDEAAAAPDAFYERSARSMQRIGRQLAGWGRDPAHAATWQRLRTRLDATCARLPAGSESRATCDGAFPAVAAPKRGAA